MISDHVFTLVFNHVTACVQMTKYQLDKQKELEEEMRLEEQRERQLASRREVCAHTHKTHTHTHKLFSPTSTHGRESRMLSCGPLHLAIWC